MAELTMLFLLGAVSTLGGVALSKVTILLRHNGRSYLTHSVGALLLLFSGGFALLRGTTGPRGLVLIAVLCVSAGVVWIVELFGDGSIGVRGGIIRCSFCGKSLQSVRKLVQASDASICDECVEICRRTISNET